MSFAEIVVIAVVALVVVGPERLPEAVRNGMLWFGRIKRAINDTKTEFEQQLGVDEIRRELHNEQVLKSLKSLEASHKKFEDDVDNFDEQLKIEIKKIEDSIDQPAPHDHNPNAETEAGKPAEHSPAAPSPAAPSSDEDSVTKTSTIPGAHS